MRAAAIKYLYWGELYNVRQTAIITGASEDYVRKVIKEERARGCAASYEDVTEDMLRRKETIDRVMGLRGAYFIEGTQKYNYVSLLAYLGYSYDELRAIFPLDNSTFMSVAARRSAQAWRQFDSTMIGIPTEDYSFTFLEEITKAEVKLMESPDTKAKEMAEWKRNQRREQKILSRNCKISKNRI